MATTLAEATGRSRANQAPNAVTVEEFWQMSQERDIWGDLIEGEIFEMTPPGLEHGQLSGIILSLLMNHVRSRKLGMVFDECGFVMSRNPDTVLAPDVSFIAAARLPPMITPQFSEVVPDLAVEVLSPSDTHSCIRDKAERYLAGGVREVWIVDPRRRVVEIVRPPDHWLSLRGADPIETPLLPGFSVPVASVFE